MDDNKNESSQKEKSEESKKDSKPKMNLMRLIKSNFIFKTLFSFLSENSKLLWVKNNKELQLRLGIDLEYYKKKSGKYKIGEKNGHGKEYDILTNNLIFEGEYLNGIKKGTGVEYKNGQIIFEGEYLNGKRNGKGKEYYDNIIVYEEEY